MRRVEISGGFADWRRQARALLGAAVPPEQVSWAAEDQQDDLFAALAVPLPVAATAPLRISARVLELLECAARFRTAERWALLYRVLWRSAHGDRSAVLAGDADGSQLMQRVKAVRHEIHHMHAFLRFVPQRSGASLAQHLAWFEPAHEVLDLMAEHFSQRMGLDSWLIATPGPGVLFDGQRVDYREDCPTSWRALAQQAASEPAPLWQQYYISIFNPARVNPQVMRGHMPQRFWRHLPEGALMPTLLTEARLGGRRYGQREALAQQRGKPIGGRSAALPQDPGETVTGQPPPG
jgi:probable DNA metabolism protein